VTLEHYWFLGTFVGRYGNMTLDGASEAVSDAIVPRFGKVVGSDYFRTMRIPLRRGRYFGSSDRAGAPGVVIVNEAAAQALWANADPIGKRLKLGLPNDERPWLTVVGVVANTVGGTLNRSRPTGFVFVPFAQQPAKPFTVIARTAGPPMAAAAALRATIRAADPDAAVDAVSTMESSLSSGISGVRFFVTLLGGMAALALGLAALGIYGVVSYTIAQRTREIGIRMALGATSQGILRLVVGYGIAMTALGLALGAAGAFALTGFLRGILFDTNATDPVVFVVVSVILATVSIAASFVPARRAVRIEPVIALRGE
jgi:putative ABC transport system permease protein